MQLTVVLATTHPWPGAAACLAALAPQVERLGGEIIVADGHGAGVDLDEAPASVRVVSAPGESVFALRARAIAEARGEIIAVTEDHCVPGPTWCLCLADALLNECPDKDAVAGPVTNGSWDSPFDRANFLMTFAESLPPLDTPQLTRMPPPANVAIRASVATEIAGRTGWMEYELLPRLWREGRFVLHRDAVVTHVQSWGAIATFTHHFFNGRASAGLAQTLTRDRGLLGWLGQPVRLTRFVVRALAGKRRLRGEAGALVLVAGLAVCHVVGEAVGTVLGPGRSPVDLE